MDPKTTILDLVLLLLTGVTALYMIYRFVTALKTSEDKPRYYIMNIIAFAVILVAGVLVIFFDFQVLNRPEIKIVATLIPFALAIGLVCRFYKQYANYFKIFLLIGLILIILLNYDVISAKFIYPIFHSVAGLTIFALPIIAVKKKLVDPGFIGVTIGGAIIGIGGIALAFLGAGKPLLGIFTADVVFAILTPILFLMTLGFAYGFMKDLKNPVKK